MTFFIEKNLIFLALKFASLEHNCHIFGTQPAGGVVRNSDYDTEKVLSDDETGTAVTQVRMNIHKAKNGGNILGLLGKIPVTLL